MTQEQLAAKLNVSFQSVSKWENGLSSPDITLLPDLAAALDTDINGLMGFVYDGRKTTLYYEEAYAQKEYYWGLEPSHTCYRIMQMMPPLRPLRVLDIGCGEGQDAVFFARNGYDVTAFDIADTGLEKARRLADQSRVSVRFFKANLLEFRLDTDFDIIFSSGVFHYIVPKMRDEILANYREHTTVGGLHAFNVFVQKPFIAPPPEKEFSKKWISGELFCHYADWRIHHCEETIFDCNSSGIPHQHCMDRIIAERVI